MSGLSFTDRVVLSAANLFAWLRHPHLSLAFLWRRRRRPTFATPAGISELVQWRKIFDRNPLFPVVVDKLRVKDWARERVPGIATADVVWSGTAARDIPTEFLEPGYVAKTNHASSTNYFPHRKPLPRAEVDAKLDGWLARRADNEAQWAYGQVPPRLMVERMVGEGSPLQEMTFRCCDGRASTASVYLAQKTPAEKRACFTPEGVRYPYETGMSPTRRLPDDYRVGPEFFEARALAERLSQGIDFVRVDFMYHAGTIYLCELTLYPDSGFGDEWRTHTAEVIYRDWLETLDRSWFFSAARSWPAKLYASSMRRWIKQRRADLDALAQQPPPDSVQH